MSSKFDTLLGALREADEGGTTTIVSSIDYKINGEAPDDDGNFEVTAEKIGAAESGHSHLIANIEELQETLDVKANTDHTHELVSGISVGDETISGAVTLEGSDNLLLNATGQLITLTAEPFATDSTEAVEDANTGNAEPLKVFSGTQAEWDTFVKEIDIRYVVFIHE